MSPTGIWGTGRRLGSRSGAVAARTAVTGGRQRAPHAAGVVLEKRLHPIPDTALVRGKPCGPCVSRPVVRGPSFPVPIDVVSGGSEDVGVVLQQSEPLVAPLAEQLPDATRL